MIDRILGRISLMVVVWCGVGIVIVEIGGFIASALLAVAFIMHIVFCVEFRKKYNQLDL